MAMFPKPDPLPPEIARLQDEWQKMARNYAGPMPQEMASFVNLMAHPAAGMAAASAVGLGMAGQAFGMWMGAMTGAAEAAQRLLAHEMSGELFRQQTQARQTGAQVRPAAPAPKKAPAATTTRAATVTALESARKAASGATKKAAKPAGAKAAAKPAARAKAAQAAPAAAAPEEKPSAMTRPAGIERPAAPDDLKQISGVGPKLEQVLNGFGIWTFEQVAGLSEGEIAWLDDQLGFGGRITRDNWTAQAASLAAAKTRN